MKDVHLKSSRAICYHLGVIILIMRLIFLSHNFVFIFYHYDKYDNDDNDDSMISMISMMMIRMMSMISMISMIRMIRAR